MPSMQRHMNTRAIALLLAAAGCASTQTTSKSRSESNDEVAEKPTRRVDAEPAADPLAAKAAPKIERREVSEDAQQAFANAVAKWDKSRKDGGRTDCDLADTFGRVADQHPDLLEARHNQAAILLECGHESDAVRIWENLASGSKPYAAAL